MEICGERICLSKRRGRIDTDVPLKIFAEYEDVKN